MIEATINALQTLIAGVCAGFSLRKSILTGSKSWLLLTLFFSSFFFGDLYWLLYLLLYGQTPSYSFAPDLNWYSAFLFLFLLVQHLQEENQPASDRMNRKPVLFMLLIPLFTFGMCAFYMRRGDYISNLVSAVLMTLLLWYSVRGLMAEKSAENKVRPQTGLVYMTTILFCTLEYCLWTSSCFWMGDTVRNPYFWFDILISFTMFLLPAALSKEVRR